MNKKNCLILSGGTGGHVIPAISCGNFFIEKGFSENELLIKNANKGLMDRINLYNDKFLLGGKTGTTQDSKDAWFIGYVDDIIIGVWIGRDDNKTTPGLFGGNLPAFIFRNIAEQIVAR